MEEKKGLLDKIKEKLHGGHKKLEDAAAATSAVHVPAPHTEDVSSSDGMEKTSLLDKIEDKRPGYHKSSGEEDAKDAAGEHKTTPALIAAHVVPLGHLQRRLLDAGRILVTGGWLVLTYTISNRAANDAHGLLGLALLLLGVFLIMLALVANQFPGVARAAAAVADAVLYYFFAPAN